MVNIVFGGKLWLTLINIYADVTFYVDLHDDLLNT